MIKFNLSNRIAIVTGGAQGFGLAITKKFLDCGAEVIVWDIDKSALNRTQESIKNEKFTTIRRKNKSQDYPQEFGIFV